MGAAWCLSTVGRYPDLVPSPRRMTALPAASSCGNSGTKVMPLMRLPNLRTHRLAELGLGRNMDQLDEDMLQPAIAFPGLAAQAFHSPPIVSTRTCTTELSYPMGHHDPCTLNLPGSLYPHTRSRYTSTCSMSVMTLLWAILGRFTGDYWTMGLLQYVVIVTLPNHAKLKKGGSAVKPRMRQSGSR